MNPLGFLGFSGGWEWIVIVIVALLLFGKRLPEVMRSMGRGIVEFKKGIKGIEDEIEQESSSRAPTPPANSEHRAPDDPQKITPTQPHD